MYENTSTNRPIYAHLGENSVISTFSRLPSCVVFNSNYTEVAKNQTNILTQQRNKNKSFLERSSTMLPCHSGVCLLITATTSKLICSYECMHAFRGIQNPYVMIPHSRIMYSASKLTHKLLILVCFSQTRAHICNTYSINQDSHGG